MANRYLDGLKPPRAMARRWRLLVLWLAIVFLVFAVYAHSTEWTLVGILVLFAVMIVVIGSTRGQGAKLRTEFELANLDRLREHHPQAVQRLRRLLDEPIAPLFRAQSLLALGECAEMVGDFAEAADVYARAEGVLRAQPTLAMAYRQVLPLVAARRAFVLAACGWFDPAEAALRGAAMRDGYPQAEALASRASIVLAARRGHFGQVRELIDRDRALHKSSFGYRDRTLLRVLELLATSRLNGALRTADAGLASERELRRWIARAVPEAEPLLGVS
jgi:hypothetical protein